ncbi:AAA family ATPase [Actinoallomurus sp. NBC_01490]|nr:AAA family ATPase [Actinoallomurus sp. NBC_01490]
MSGGDAVKPSEEDRAKKPGEDKAVEEDEGESTGAWTNTPPAPTFPQYPAPQDAPAQPPAEGPQPYGFGFPGYPPQDFGAVQQPPQFPGMPAPGSEYAHPPYQPPEQPAAYESMPPVNGANAAEPPPAEPEPQPAPAEPEERYETDEGERTHYIDRRLPAAEATQVDSGYDNYAEGGYQGYVQYPPPQYGPPPEQGYPGQQYYGPPPGVEQPPYQGQQQYGPPPEAEQGPYQQPYAQPQQYGPPPEAEQGPYQPYAMPPQPYSPAAGGEQGPPLAPLPDAYAPQPETGQTADSLSADTLLRGRRHAPAGGWRRAVYKASGGVIHPGESPQELRKRELLARARTPVAGGHHRVAVMSLKGGVGKTTTTVGLGSTLASLRGDRVIAVDANPDRGTLSDKVRLETATTVRDLLNEHQQIQRYADVRAYTSQSSSRLEVLASDRDPAVSEAFSEDDYRTVAHVLEHFYSICLTDCGTGLLHSAMAGVLGLANQLVLVSSPSVDGARSASATLDWLEAHHYGDLVRNGVVVLSMVRSRSRSTVDLDRLQAHFESRCRAVVRIPYDPHLEEGAEVELDQLSAATQDAYLVLAATVGDGFAWPR